LFRFVRSRMTDSNEVAELKEATTSNRRFHSFQTA
jgi:hypothetical protein